MSKKTIISSKNQQGGVTAHTVHQSTKENSDNSTSLFRKFSWLVGVATVVGVIYTALTYYGS